MKLSTKGIYAVTAVLDLAVHQNEGVISLRNIAERQNISENYLEQIFLNLRRKDIIASSRGAQGGYFFTKDPKDITVGSILRAMEGSLMPVSCAIDGADTEHCGRYDKCVTRCVWESIGNAIYNVVDQMTVGELALLYEQTHHNGNYMYYI